MMKTKFWQTLEALPDGAVLAEWALELGNEFERSRPFLQPTPDVAKTFPCTNQPRCDCLHHRIEPLHSGACVAVCDCGHCAPLRLTRADLTVHELNRTLLAESLTRLCGWRQSPTAPILPGVWRLGIWSELRANLYWCAGGRADRVRRMVDSLFSIDSSPFILVLPTRANLTPSLDAALKREGCCALPLEEHLTIEATGKLKLEQSIAGIRDEFEERAATRRDAAKVLRGIEGKIDRAGSIIGSKVRERATARFLFRPAGSMCDVVFDGSTVFHVKNTDGAKYLDYLLHRPNLPIRAFALELAVKPDKGQAREHNSIQKTMDSQAKREAREEIQELQAEFEDAEAQGMISIVTRLQGEIAKLKAVAENNSLMDSDTGERARDNVRKAISKVIANLRKGGKVEQSFAQHIAQFISLGYDIAYNQPKGNCWE